MPKASGFFAGAERGETWERRRAQESAGEKSQMEDSPFASLQYLCIVSYVLKRRKHDDS